MQRGSKASGAASGAAKRCAVYKPVTANQAGVYESSILTSILTNLLINLNVPSFITSLALNLSVFSDADVHFIVVWRPDADSNN